MKLYLASSWRNAYHAGTLAALRLAGHEVYDFKSSSTAFNWREVDPLLMSSAREGALTAVRLRDALRHPAAEQGFQADLDAMRAAEACVLLLPAGLSAHLEAGWFAGAGRPVVVFAPEIREPELMYKLFDSSVFKAKIINICGTLGELDTHLAFLPEAERADSGEAPR